MESVVDIQGMNRSQMFEDCKNMRLYFHPQYKRWTVDVAPLNPINVERKTFLSKDKAMIFARAKKTELFFGNGKKSV